MTASMVLPRRSRACVSPSTHLKASTMLLLPEPLGPTIPTMPPSKRISVRRAKVLKPLRWMARKYTALGRRLPDVGAVSAGGRCGLRDSGRAAPPLAGIVGDGGGDLFGISADLAEEPTGRVAVATKVQTGRARGGFAGVDGGLAVLAGDAQ